MKLTTILAILAAVSSAGTMMTSTCLAQTPTTMPRHPVGSPYGINNWDFGPREVQMMKDTGVRWARVMVSWNSVEPKEGQYDWKGLDEAVKNLDAAGMAIDFSYHNVPGWSYMPGGTGLAAPEKMARFVGQCAARYKGKVDAHEIYNEDICGIWPHVAERSAQKYVPTLQACYKAVKEVEPRQMVLAGGLWQFPMYYLEDMYKAGAKGYFDALNFHFYISAIPGGPATVDAFRGDFAFPLYYLRAVSRKYNDIKPIWVTEVGWSISTENQAHPVSLEDQAKYLQYAYRTTMETGIVDKVFWYVFYMQDGMSLIHRNDTSAKFGPAAAADFKRPAYKVMCDFIAKYPQWDANRAKPLPIPAPASKPATIVNAGFESEGGWTLPAGVQRVETAQEGKYALQLVSTGTDTVRAEGTPFAVEPGKCYEVRGWAKTSGGWEKAQTGHVMWEIEFFDESGKRLDMVGPLHDNRPGEQLSTNYYVNETFGQWQELHYPVIVPEEARTARLAARVGLHPGTALFDAVSFTPLDVRPK